jgi:thioredoxin 1
MNMAVKHATDATLEQMLRQHKVALVDFWAPWCGPCRMIAPILDQLAEEVAGEAVILKVNVDENPVSAMKYGIRSIPTLKLFVNGIEVQTLVGVRPLQQLKSLVLQYAS